MEEMIRQAPELTMMILNLILTVLVGLLMFFLKGFQRSIRDRFKEDQERIEKIETELHAFKEKMPEKYVLRDDWLRTMAAFDAKLDRIQEAVNELRAN